MIWENTEEPRDHPTTIRITCQKAQGRQNRAPLLMGEPWRPGWGQKRGPGLSLGSRGDSGEECLAPLCSLLRAEGQHTADLSGIGIGGSRRHLCP